MASSTDLSLFLLAALIIAAIPGPGIFYVAARTLAGGRKTGIASTLGTALGGLAHVVAGALASPRSFLPARSSLRCSS
jgi:threonine/homoserine/homoserine lactone efflux protein